MGSVHCLWAGQAGLGLQSFSPPWQPLGRGSPPPHRQCRKPSDPQKPAQRQQEFNTFHQNNVLKLKRLPQHKRRPRNAGRALLPAGSLLPLAAPAWGGSRIPQMAFPPPLPSSSPPPPPSLGPLGFQKSRKSKRSKEKSSTLLNQFQGWMCAASQRSGLGKTRAEVCTTARQVHDPGQRWFCRSPRPSPCPPGEQRATLGHSFDGLWCLPNSSAS